MIFLLFPASSANKNKNRYPIPQGDRTLLVKRITCDFQARLARLKQFGYANDYILLHIVLHLGELVRLGYSFSMLQKCWGNACGPQYSSSWKICHKPSPGNVAQPVEQSWQWSQGVWWRQYPMEWQWERLLRQQQLARRQRW